MVNAMVRNLGLRLAAVLLVAPALLPMNAAADTVMVTGANSGIGLEFAKQYARQGWTVIATHRRAEPPKTLTDLAAQYPKVPVSRAWMSPTWTKRKSWRRNWPECPIDVLINNAGVYNDRAKCAAEDDSCPGDWGVESFGNLKYSLLDTIMAVNIKGPLIVSETFYKNVLASGQKKIIAVSSSNGTLTGEAVPASGRHVLPHEQGGPEPGNADRGRLDPQRRRNGRDVQSGATLTEHQAYLEGKYQGMLKTSFTVET